MFDKNYYHQHTKHYEKTKLINIPSFLLVKKMLDVRPDEKLLDAGCGTGYLLDFVADHNCKGVGIDVSSYAIKTAQKNYPHLSFKVSGITKIPFKENHFDKILCFNVIEHLEEIDQQKAMKEFRRVLKRNGILVIGTNIKDSLSWRLFNIFFGGDPTHKREFGAGEFIEFVNQFFHVEEYARSGCIGRFFPPINKFLNTVLRGDIIVKAKK